MRYRNETTEKTNGIVYTPSDLAQYVANQMLGNYHKEKKTYKILDPAIGYGELTIALIEALYERFDNPKIEVFGYETDYNIIEQTEQRISDFCHDVKVFIENKSFLDSTFNESNQKYDFIIANPPYIRTQILGAEKAQEIALSVGLDGRVDIYYAFLILAERLLKKDGIAGFVTSNKFMTVKSGQTVRKHFTFKTDILQITDFGDTKLFTASVLPCVIIFRPKQITKSETVYTSVYESKKSKAECSVDNIFEALDDSKTIELYDGRTFNVIKGTLQADPNGSSWRISTAIRNSWLEKVESNTVKYFSQLGKVRVGIKTTADNVFIKESWKQEEYIPELLRPLITPKNAGQISADNDSRWQVLYTHTVVDGKKVAVNIEQFPNSLMYLSTHREQLESRDYLKKANRNWYEIWVPQNPNAWKKRKIVFRDITEIPQFWLDESGAIVSGNCYWIDLFDKTLEDEVFLALAVANSKFIEQYYDICFNNKLYSGKRRFMSQYVEQFPLPDCTSKKAQSVIRATKEVVYNSPSRQQKKVMLEEISALVESLFVS